MVSDVVVYDAVGFGADTAVATVGGSAALVAPLELSVPN